MSIAQRNIFSWLHISDLHFGHGDDTYKWDQKSVLTALHSDVEMALENWPELPKPDAVFITGDIGFSGDSLELDEYKQAENFIDGIANALGLPRSMIFMTPGNHDVQRTINKEIIDEIRAPGTKIDSYIKSGENRKKLYERFSNYQKFSDTLHKRNFEYWEEKISIPDFGNIAIMGVNTALTSGDDNDKGNLVLTGEQLHFLSSTHAKVRLVLTHHPLNELWIKNEQSAQHRLMQDQTVHLYGHVHNPDVKSVSSAGLPNNHVRVIAAAAHQDPRDATSGKDSHGYNFGSLVVDQQGDLIVRTWPRRWLAKVNNFRVDHFGGLDRFHFDDRLLGKKFTPSGLNLDTPDKVHLDGVHWWGDHIAWNKLLFNKKKLDIFGISVRALFEQPNHDHIKDFLDNGGKVSVVLADPRDKHTMAQYEIDFASKAGDRTAKVIATLSLMLGIQKRLKSPENLTIAVTSHYFKYSAYRIDEDVLFVPYRLIPGKATEHTPGLLFEKSGSVVQRFFKGDLDGLLESATILNEEALTEILKAG